MALSVSDAEKARIAFQRFGLGAKKSTFKRVAADPMAALVRELNKPKVALYNGRALPSYKKAASQSQKSFDNAENFRRKELEARVKKHLRADIGFVERLVLFWSNHFNMSVRKSNAVRGTIGHLERTVIRKHVLGNFSNMLLGVMQHPAMISFLDNDDSVGPNSKYGRDRGAGFNENLGREAMELHTIGSGGGYTEEDVTALALILTGWSYVRNWEADNGYNNGRNRNRGRFIYRKTWHEPGAITLMGKSYPPTGRNQGKAALLDLARHPATAEHIAFKLVRHFITDEPTPEMVEPLKQAFIKSGGNLKTVSLALLQLPEAFSAPLTKLRTPYELAIAQFRALNKIYKKDDYWWAFAGPLSALNNMPWECASPEGYPDETLYWLDPDGMTLRLDTAKVSGWVYGNRYRSGALSLARSLYDSALTPETKQRISEAGSKSSQFTVLFCSPEFQRR
jgi:uncharacterized protein (DUF1800 family)